MVYLRVNEMLKEKKKSKYWFVRQMEGGYQALSNLMNNETFFDNRKNMHHS